MLAVGLGACVIVLCVKRGLGLCYRWPKDPRASTSQPSQYTATTRGENESLVFQAHSVSESASFMEDSLDYYPDEGEDDFTEAASFVTWLTQASIKHATSTHNSDQDSGLPLQQQSQQYQHSFQASRDSGEGQPSAFVNEKFITYLPFAGLSNQFYGMLRAMYIARALGRTLLLPPITSSSHDKTRKNQPWSDFFDLNKFQRRTGLRVIEYHSLRDQGNFRGPTGIRESGSSVGASWISPLQYGGDGTHSPEPRRSGILGQSSFVIQDQKDGNFVSQEPNTPSLTEKSFMMATYQHSPGTGTGSVDMSMPCHVTCGFGSKRGLDYTAKAFLRQWGFEYKKLMLPTKPKPSKSLQSDETTNKESDKEKVNSVPIDQTREFNRILESLMDESLEKEPLICISNTYKIQVPTTSTAQDPGVSSGPSFTIDSPEWHEFGQHLFFQPRLVQFVNTFLEQTLGQSPEHRLVFEKETFGSVHMQRSSSQTQQSTLGPQTNHTFFMLHVRRGDFESYCKKDFPDDKLFSQCLPPVEAYFKVVEDLQLWAQHQVQAQGQPLGFPVPEDMTSEDAKTQLILDRDSQVKKAGSRRKIPVIVGTNEHRAEELARLRRPKATSDEGDDDEWIVLDHDKLKTVEHFGVFGPMMIEQVLMAEAEVLVGVKMSTFSRVGAYRQRDWYGRRIVYM
ncbi:hypothetical protein BGW38_010668 [Lunasporangiospora selenospora]|uniref:GDP-fucose protein O-fucosyltransferase 2 n=1 Tax=Lunasporangiospora selenospora TaxID=979761 RepID=A0A9P6G414_9FUNG|nr:hypothetical protein BGW38_010668 [Lunasporangiospora selenospora]